MLIVNFMSFHQQWIMENRFLRDPKKLDKAQRKPASLQGGLCISN